MTARARIRRKVRLGAFQSPEIGPRMRLVSSRISLTMGILRVEESERAAQKLNWASLWCAQITTHLVVALEIKLWPLASPGETDPTPPRSVHSKSWMSLWGFSERLAAEPKTAFKYCIPAYSAASRVFGFRLALTAEWSAERSRAQGRSVTAPHPGGSRRQSRNHAGTSGGAEVRPRTGAGARTTPSGSALSGSTLRPTDPDPDPQLEEPTGPRIREAATKGSRGRG